MITHEFPQLINKTIAMAELHLSNSNSNDSDDLELHFTDGSVYVFVSAPVRSNFAHYGLVSAEEDIPAVYLPLARKAG